MKRVIVIFIVLGLIGCSGTPEPESFESSWESLSQHEAAPEWFRDAKLGIYFHWGVYSVPAYGNEWYPRWMHFEGNDYYEHHLAKYGHPSEFGYHDFVPIFKAENFDAGEWADLFVKAGARFAGPVAEHHDGFSMWDSEATPWNAADMGPKRDITGELAKAIRERDMKFITTFHHAKHLQRYKANAVEELTSVENQRRQFRQSHYPFIEGMPTVSEDEQLKYLYGNIPEEQWLEEVWLGKLKEVIDQYQPDIIWFDSWLDQIPEAYRQKFSAYYLNEAEKWDKEVVIVRKQDDLPLNYTVDDLEKSRKNRLEPEPWMTDETVSRGSWCYTEDLEIKESKDVLHVLIDIVSKNGVLLLNISPMANGTIPADQKKVLTDMGGWLEQYGEAIYDTRPWYIHGEGPTMEPEGHFKNNRAFLNITYSWKDIRYTTMGETIYATMLGWPGTGETLELKSFASDSLAVPIDVKSVVLLGSNEEIEWEQSNAGLSITTPTVAPDEMAITFKIETD
ncbi:MAG: alpha-L-fucosidase [Bacteroidetes bacterium]|nr:alpha-L-fucosidase [Bacteroidota bacterium]